MIAGARKAAENIKKKAAEAGIYLTQGNQFKAAGEYGKAIATYQKAISIHPLWGQANGVRYMLNPHWAVVVGATQGRVR